MLKWLLPHESNFYFYFDQHAAIMVQSAIELDALVRDPKKVNDKAQILKDLEHQADIVTHQCVEELHKTFITPFQRDDIHRLISHLDDIVDGIEDISTRIKIYKIHQTQSDAEKLSSILLKSTQKLEEILNELKESKNFGRIKQLLTEIDDMEHEADDIYFQAIEKLFNQNHDPLNVMKWKEIYDSLENTIDICQDVGNIIEGVILEST